MHARGIFSIILILCFKFFNNDEVSNLSIQLQSTISKFLLFLPETNPAKTKLEVTSSGFIRFTQTFKNGKQHYSSLNLNQFSGLGYFGTAQSGILVLYSAKKNVIIQTFHDPSGEVDSMSNRLNIPLTKVEPEQLNTIQSLLQRIRYALKK